MQSGDACPNCGHYLTTINTIVKGDRRVRYLGCTKCRHRPEDNKVIVPLRYAPRRGQGEQAVA